MQLIQKELSNSEFVIPLQTVISLIKAYNEPPPVGGFYVVGYNDTNLDVVFVGIGYSFPKYWSNDDPFLKLKLKIKPSDNLKWAKCLHKPIKRLQLVAPPEVWIDYSTVKRRFLSDLTA